MENQKPITLADLLRHERIDSSLVLEALRHHAKSGEPLKAADVAAAVDKAGMDNYDLTDAHRHLGEGCRLHQLNGNAQASEYISAMDAVASRIKYFEF